MSKKIIKKPKTFELNDISNINNSEIFNIQSQNILKLK